MADLVHAEPKQAPLVAPPVGRYGDRAEVIRALRREAEPDPELEDDAFEPDAVVDEPTTRNFELRLAPADPTLFLVPADATVEDVAARLLRDERAGDQLDFVAVPGTDRAVRVRDTSRLAAPARDALAAALDAALQADVDWMIAAFRRGIVGQDAESQLVERCLRWSQRSEITLGGRQYFDRFLDRLDATAVVQQGLFAKPRRTAFDVLLTEGGEQREILEKAIARRSSHAIGYRVTDAAPEYARDDILGRFYSSTGGSIQLRVEQVLAQGRSLQDVERRARSSSQDWLRAIVPGADGVFRAYLVFPNTVLGAKQPEDDPGGRFYAYTPGTIFIGAHEYRTDYAAGDASVLSARAELLADALASATPKAPGPLLGLDFEVLARATIEQRVKIFDTILTGPGASSDEPADLLIRTLYSTPAADFPALERRLATSGAMDLILSADDLTTGHLAAIGKVFGARMLETVPLSPAALREMPTIKLGVDSEGMVHYAIPQRVKVAAGTAIEFYPAAWKRGMVMGAPQPSAAPSRALSPGDLVRVEVLGDHPQTLMITALEAAGSVDLSRQEFWRGFNRLAVVWSIAMGAAGVLRALGPAAAEGLVASGGRAALAAAGRAAAEEAGRQAIKRLAFDVALGVSMIAVDEHREQLQETPEGREFLAVYDVALAVMAVRDIRRLAKSGLIEALASRSAAMLRSLPGTAQAAMRDTAELWEAARLALTRWVEPAKVAKQATTEGLAVAERLEKPGFTHLFKAARGEVAARSVVAALGKARRSTADAQRILDRLQELAKSSEPFAGAFSAVARGAAREKPAAAEALLRDAEEILNARPAAKPFVADLLKAISRETAPAAMKDVRWLLELDVSDEALEGLAGRAAKAGDLDLAWLRKRGFLPEELNALGAHPQTPWRMLKRASENLGDVALQKRAGARIRGIAAEIAGGERINIKGWRISNTQIETPGGSVLDFELTSTDRRGAKRLLEVKGYTKETWAKALDAWHDWTLGRRLSSDDKRKVVMLHNMLKQLGDARAATGQAPVLAITDALKGPSRDALDRLLRDFASGTDVVTIAENDIMAISRRLREVLGM